MTRIADNLARLREGIRRAAERAGRDPAGVALVAVSKRQPLERVREALDLGVRVLGENYAQELAKRRELFPEAEWHFVGHVQRNKVRLLVPGVRLIHSVAAARTADALSKRALSVGETVRILVEVDTAGGERRTGASEEEAPGVAAHVAGLPGLELAGLMAMPAPAPDPEAVRPELARVRALRDRLQDALGVPLPELSMGMSNDYEIAVEEGATLVRVGTALFGPRPVPAAGRTP